MPLVHAGADPVLLGGKEISDAEVRSTSSSSSIEQADLCMRRRGYLRLKVLLGRLLLLQWCLLAQLDHVLEEVRQRRVHLLY
jgi:hypothetical protein